MQTNVSTLIACHTTNPVVVNEVGIEFFMPTDARHWIPNGYATVDMIVDAESLEDDFFNTIEAVADAWCDANFGKGSFSQVIMED